MKNSGIQNKKRFIEITINEDEAKLILKDLIFLDRKETPLNHNTAYLILTLKKFEVEK
jgi:hypothetical protein